MSNLIEEQDVKSQMFPFGAFKFTDPAADATPTLSLKAPWMWSANLAFTTVTDANGTVATTDPYVQYYYSTGNSDRTCTLPAATGSGQVVAVYKTDTGTGDVDVTPAGTDKINGYNAVWKINAQNQYVVLQDRAAGEWHVLDCLGTLLEYENSSDVSPGLTHNVWMNPASHNLTITPGIWAGGYRLGMAAYHAGTSYITFDAALSTANNAVSNTGYISRNGVLASVTGRWQHHVHHLHIPSIVVAASTPYYLIMRGANSASNNFGVLTTSGSSLGTNWIKVRRIA